MAQPIFDEHPLQDYLRRSLHSHQRKTSHTHALPLFTESGDIFEEPIPGAISGLSCPFSDGSVDEPDHDLKLCPWLTTPMSRLAEVSLSHITFPGERVPLADPTAVSILLAPCVIVFRSSARPTFSRPTKMLVLVPALGSFASFILPY